MHYSYNYNCTAMFYTDRCTFEASAVLQEHGHNDIIIMEAYYSLYICL